MSAPDPRLGRLRLVRRFGKNWYISPDLATWIAPTTITLALVIGTIAVAGHVPLQTRFGWELWWLLGEVSLALLCSLLCGVTDPGVVPRLLPGQPDPNKGDESLRFCDYCAMRRPHRAAHCHVCNVCVLEHDHHCGVIGGCVGQRSLRYFAAYLVLIGVSTSHGCWWLIRSLMQLNREHEGLFSRRVGPRNGRSTGDGDGAGPALAYHIMLIIFVGNVGLVVGCLGVYYLALVCSDTTRREAQGRGRGKEITGESAALVMHEHHASDLRSRWSWRFLGRLGRVTLPPPSLLDEALELTARLQNHAGSVAV
jgi:hypothetical protein